MSAGQIPSWLLGAALTVGAIKHGIPAAPVRDRYGRRGYSQRFRRALAGLALVTAGLVVVAPTRTLGTALAIAITAGMIGSALALRAPGRAILPAIILLLAIVTNLISSS
ncbi:DoxX family protein [Novosphingobium sp. Chol11]|uniref:DoxX family protein n=1 Tax=Novosphingobium sp. Chol11 TaxID=1385763 RepID=UPI000BE2EF4E|nr:DoxX family protein [Novosphingobium sp. Chol11]